MANHNVVFVEENGTNIDFAFVRQHLPENKPSQSRLAACQLPRRGSFIYADRKMQKLPHSGELANVVSLRGFHTLYPRSISLYSHASASERPPSSSISFSFTARRPSSTVPMSMTSSPVWSIS